MKKSKHENQLQISNFIKEPENLKLLILAGTQLQITEFITIRKCINLIKLDLSSNGLKSIPIPIHQFKVLKILFLHDNSFDQLDSLNLKDSVIQYLTLFNNPLKKYRKFLINHLPKLKGIDFNMISQHQKNLLSNKQQKNLPFYTELKWPIVELEKGLENQVDYLNLLKAEIFVLNNVYLKSYYTEMLERFIVCIPKISKIDSYERHIISKNIKHKQLIKRCVEKWKKFIKKRVVLRKHLVGINKQYLIFNNIQYKKYLRSNQANQIIRRYVEHIRKSVSIQKILRHNLAFYSRIVMAQRNIYETKKVQNQNFSVKFYMKESQLPVFQKICLYTKKLLFNNKNYDLCDDFSNLVKPTSKVYIILREQHKIRKSYTLQMISLAMNMIIIQNYTQMKNILYNKKGHKEIRIKRCRKQQYKLTQNQKILSKQSYDKLQYLFSKYDKLIEYEIKDQKIYQYLVKLLKYFNAGNQRRILKNIAAYFQTQIPQEDVIDEYYVPFLKKKIYFFQHSLIRRIASAVKIQKAWRKYLIKNKTENDIIRVINADRAVRLIQKWSRNIIFYHRMNFKKKLPFYQKSIRTSTLYIQLYIYMGLPKITNILKIYQQKQKNSNYFLTQNSEKQYQDLYQVMHKNTKIKLMWISGLKWVKIEFSSLPDAIQRARLLAIYTYRLYFNGHFIKFYSFDASIEDNTAYEKQILKSFKLIAPPLIPKIDNKNIDNQTSVFIIQKGNNVLNHKMTKLAHTTIKNAKINMFVINAGKRPLKVQGELSIIIHNNIYLQNHLPKQFTIRQSVKLQQKPQIPIQYYMPKPFNKLRDLKNIKKELRHSSFQQSPKTKFAESINSIKLISETIPFRKK